MRATARKDASRGPVLVAAPVLVQVVTLAGHRCECTRRGCHGRGERCERGLPQVRLIAAPRDVTVPAHAAWRVSVAELAAWCGRCHELAVAAGRRERGADLEEATAVDPLGFEVSAVTP